MTHAGEKVLDVGRSGGAYGNDLVRRIATWMAVRIASRFARLAKEIAGAPPVAGSSLPGASPRVSVLQPWLLFRADWGTVLWRVYQKMNDNRLMAVAAGVVFYGLLAVFPAITAFVSLYGFMADPTTIHERLSLATGVLPQGALNILNEQLTQLTSHRTSALSFGFILGLVVALWSANAGAKAVMDALNVAYGETEKRSFVRLNLVALAFTLGTIVALMLSLGRGGGRSDCAFAAWIERRRRNASSPLRAGRYCSASSF